GRRGRPAELLTEPGHDPAQLEVQLLDSPRHADGPTSVAEVALELAENGRSRERRELETPAGIESFHRLEEPNQRDLDQVVDRLTAVRETAGEKVRQRRVLLDELIATATIAGRGGDAESLAQGAPRGPGPPVFSPVSHA